MAKRIREGEHEAKVVSRARFMQPGNALQAGWKAFWMSRRMMRYKKCWRFAGDAGLDTYCFDGTRRTVEQYTSAVTVIAPDNIVKFRPTDISQGVREDQRVGSQVCLHGMQMELMFVSAKLAQDPDQQYDASGNPVPLYAPNGMIDRTRMVRQAIRILVVETHDEVESFVAGQIQPPGLLDMFQGANPQAAFGAAVTASPVNAMVALFGTYLPKLNPDTQATAVQDRNAMRRRKFKILYDKTIRVNIPNDEAIPSAQAILIGADEIETSMARKRVVSVNIPFNDLRVSYLESATQALNEVTPNIYIYVFSNDGNGTGGNWPFDGGLQTCVRPRGRLFFSDC